MMPNHRRRLNECLIGIRLSRLRSQIGLRADALFMLIMFTVKP